VITSFRRLFVIYRDYRGRLILSQLLVLISAAATIGVATLTQRVINDGLLKDDSGVVIETGIWMIVLGLVAAAALAGAAVFAVFFSEGTAYVIRSELYRHVQRLSFENFDRLRTGNLLVRLGADVNQISNAVLYSVIYILYAPFMLLVAFILTAIQIPSLLWVLAVSVVGVLALMAIIVPRVFAAYDERQQRLDDLNNTLQESIAGVRVVKAFTREELEVERFRDRADGMRRPAFRAAFLVAALGPLLVGLTQLLTATSIWVGGDAVINGSGLNLGELTTFIQYLALTLTPLALMAVVIPFILRGDASAARIFAVYDTPPALADDAESSPLEPASVAGRLVFENVSFAFRRPDGELDPPAIKDIDLTIEPGERIGFLGATGAGKSALVNLIPRFYDPTEGRITLDDVDIRQIPLDDLRRTVGIALQEALLFRGDIRFNLKFGAPDASDDEMVGAATAADAAGFVTNLPEQWDAPVARRGYNFSGGQRQRLAIGRSLTPRPRVLVLDDSTSALDVATEGRVQDAIPQFAGDVTTLYVAQRISAVINLDRIVLLDEGRIADVGTHEELLARSGLYQEIYVSQLGGLPGQTGGGE
jgi:ABC-type multidrug transport system fused ATPase/permease subunit